MVRSEVADSIEQERQTEEDQPALRGLASAQGVVEVVGRKDSANDEANAVSSHDYARCDLRETSELHLRRQNRRGESSLDEHEKSGKHDDEHVAKIHYVLFIL